MNCPSCGAETSRLIGCHNLQRVVCTNCHGDCKGQQVPGNANLGQTLDSDGKTRVTYGKAWEIKNRGLSKDDGKTIINLKTGKPAEY